VAQQTRQKRNIVLRMHEASTESADSETNEVDIERQTRDFYICLIIF